MTSREDLVERFRGKACKTLPCDASAQEKRDMHRIKMEMKRILRAQMQPDVKPHILANISRNHEHYGDTPIEHERRKVENNS